MSGVESTADERCAAGCRRCAAPPASADAGAPSGWRLAATAAGCFLVPLVLALAGAAAVAAVWPSQAGQLLGGLGGLVFGMAASAVAVRLLGGGGQSGER